MTIPKICTATLLLETFAGRKLRAFAVFSQNREIKFHEISSFFANRENQEIFQYIKNFQSAIRIPRK